MTILEDVIREQAKKIADLQIALAKSDAEQHYWRREANRLNQLIEKSGVVELRQQSKS